MKDPFTIVGSLDPDVPDFATRLGRNRNSRGKVKVSKRREKLRIHSDRDCPWVYTSRLSAMKVQANRTARRKAKQYFAEMDDVDGEYESEFNPGLTRLDHLY